jgi:dTDP-4-amino-4,6-dideoxygalactose transaminase
MKVPFLNLKAQHDALRNEINAAIQEVIDASAFAGGPFVAAFEQDFAAYCGTKHAVGLGSGTEALWLALIGLGVGAGDEVITVPSTFMATAEAITYCGAKPVFVDVEQQTCTLDPALLEKAITPRTKAIMPVHLFGQVADMDPIMEIARRRGLFVVEDACQAHGAEYKGRRAGSIGHAGAFSFYPGKNLGALGEGGATVTNDSKLSQHMAMMRDHGQRKKYAHDLVGWNARMDGIQGAVLKIKLKHLDRANEARRQHAAIYSQLLADEKAIRLPVEAAGRRHVWHLYAIRTPNRDAIMEVLTQRGIGCGIHYPIPVHLQEAYRSLGLKKGSFPVAERCAEEFISLPMFPELTREQVETVVRELKAAMARHGNAAVGSSA